MLKKYYGVFGPAFRILDALILAVTWVIAYFLRRDFPLPLMKNAIPPFEQYVGYLAVMLLLWGVIFTISDVYSSKRMVRRTAEAYRVLRAHAISLLIFIALTYLFSTYRLSRGVFVYFGIMSGFLFVAVRLILRNSLRRLRSQGFNLQNTLVVGRGSAAHELVARLRRHPELGLHIVGSVGERRGEGELPCLGSFEEVRVVVHQHNVQKVIIALSRQEYPGLDAILRELRDEVVDVVLVPDIHEYLVLGCEVEEFDGIPLVGLNETPMQGFNMWVKRAVDLGLASTVILIFGPFMAAFAVLVKATSPGPVFYTQERMSLNGRRFKMLKFRSMSVDQKGDMELLTKKNDPRVTAVGSFMRKTSVDELPQLFNVLRGDMSLVGPRPERTWVVEELRGKIPSYMLKHKVKAGITGWAQVNGWRGNTSLEKRIEYDLYYIRNWSLLFDLKILFLTVFKGFTNRNAY